MPYFFFHERKKPVFKRLSIDLGQSVEFFEISFVLFPFFFRRRIGHGVYIKSDLTLIFFSSNLIFTVLHKKRGNVSKRKNVNYYSIYCFDIFLKREKHIRLATFFKFTPSFALNMVSHTVLWPEEKMNKQKKKSYDFKCSEHLNSRHIGVSLSLSLSPVHKCFV